MRITLDMASHDALCRIAAKQGVTQTECLRGILHDYIAQHADFLLKNGVMKPTEQRSESEAHLNLGK